MRLKDSRTRIITSFNEKNTVKKKGEATSYRLDARTKSGGPLPHVSRGSGADSLRSQVIKSLGADRGGLSARDLTRGAVRAKKKIGDGGATGKGRTDDTSSSLQKSTPISGKKAP